MKCLLVVRNPSMPDIVFIWSDAEFKTHIAQSLVDRNLAESCDIQGDLDISILTQYFSPMIASHGLLASEMNCPYSSITCNNGFLFVMKQFGQHLYLTVNGDKEESEQFLHKKLLVFHRIVEFFFGPATEEIRPDFPNQRNAMWDKLGNVLNSWCELYHREQSFLLEAVETLEVNQTLKELCVGLLESVLLKFRSVGDKNAVHAMLIAGAKLMTLFSSRNAGELHPADELLIITLAHALFPAPTDPLQENQEDTAPNPQGVADDENNRISGMFSDVEFMSAGEGCLSDGSQNSHYYSPANSQDEQSLTPSDDNEEEERPHWQDKMKRRSMHRSDREDHPVPEAAESGQTRSHGTGSRMSDRSMSEDSQSKSWCDLTDGMGPDTASIPSINCTPNKRVSHPPNSQTVWYTPVESRRADDAPKARHDSDSSASSGHPPSPSEPRNARPQPMPPSNRSTGGGGMRPGAGKESASGHRGGRTVEEAVRVMVFLHQSCPHSPHVLHIVRILPSITLVVVSEVNNQVATWVSNCSQRLNVLTNAVSRSSDGGEVLHRQSSVAKLDADLKQLGNAVKKSRVQGLQQAYTELIKFWTIAKRCGLTTGQGAEVAITPRLEATLSEMNKVLQEIFQRCYIARNVPLFRTPSWLKPALNDVRASLRESLSLYHDYLAVKAERNLTMTNYLDDFPGLVHYARVNRTAHQLLAPSINVNCEPERIGTGKKLLHEKVWSMVERCHEQLQRGYILETLRQGDFTFSYLLYFEDSSLGLLVPNRGIPANMKTPCPGILAGNFFREVVDHAYSGTPHHSVTCYELFCIHLSVVPTPMITANVRRLRTLLGAGDDVVTPSNLL